jgi:DNA polymerase-3 subunit gamma/tau
LSALNLASQAEINYKQSKQPRLLVELALMKMCFLPQFQTGQELADGVKKKVAEQPQVQQFSGNPPAASIKIASIPAAKAPAAAETTPPETVTVAPAMASATIAKPKVSGATIKIGKNLAGIKTTPAASEEVASDTEALAIENLDFAEAWSRLLQETKQARKDYLHAILLENQPVLNERHECALNIHNEAQRQLLEAEKTELLEKIRRWTGNFSIQFAYVFLKNDAESIKPVTSVDKFGRMVEKNPHLLTMVEKFGLDIQY